MARQVFSAVVVLVGDLLTFKLAAAMAGERIGQVRKLSKQIHAVDGKAAKIEFGLGLTTCAFEDPVTYKS